MSPQLPSGELSASDRVAFYRTLSAQVEAVIDLELTETANLANVSSVLYHALVDIPVSRKINWCGFYVLHPQRKDTLILGPFQGRVACTLIPFGKGVCGTAASSLETQLVHDVHLFKGHIACDSASESEIVVPIVVNNILRAVLDIDCLEKNGFDEDDRIGLETIANHISKVFI